MHKLGIPDPAGIMGKTLGRTIKLPAAVTHSKASDANIANFFYFVKNPNGVNPLIKMVTLEFSLNYKKLATWAIKVYVVRSKIKSAKKLSSVGIEPWTFCHPL